MAAAGWVALASAQAGGFSPTLAAVAAALTLGSVIVWSRGRRWWGDVTRADVVTVALAAAGTMALWPPASPWPTFLDASWYLNTAAGVARYRSLSWRPEVLDALGPTPALVTTFDEQRRVLPRFPAGADRGFFDVAFVVPSTATTEVQPYHPPYWASWLALGYATRPPWPGARVAVMILPWSLAYLLASAAVARRTFGPAAGPVAVAVAAAGAAFAYYGATPFAEVPAGALALAGLALAAELASRRRPAAGLAFAVGLALGLAALVKVEQSVAAGAVGLWWLAARRRTGGRRELAAGAAGVAIPLVHLGLLAAGPTRVYAQVNGWGVARLLPAAALAAGAGIAVVVAVTVGRRRLAPRLPVADMGAGLVLVGLAAGTVFAQGGPEGGAPSMVGLLWWTATPLGVWAAGVAAVLALRRRWAPAGPVLAMAVATAVALVLVPGVTRSLSPLYAARRFVPVVLPAIWVLAAGAAVSPVGWGAGPGGVGAGGRSRRGAATAFAAGGAIVLLVAALWAQSRSVRSFRDFSGGSRIVADLAADLEPRGLAVFPSPLAGSHAGRMAAPLWLLTGQPAAVLGSPAAAEGLPAIVEAWSEAGRPVYYIVDEAGEVPEVPGYRARWQAEETWIAPLLAPAPSLPPTRTKLEMVFRVFRYEAQDQGD